MNLHSIWHLRVSEVLPTTLGFWGTIFRRTTATTPNRAFSRAKPLRNPKDTTNYAMHLAGSRSDLFSDLRTGIPHTEIKIDNYRPSTSCLLLGGFPFRESPLNDLAYFALT